MKRWLGIKVGKEEGEYEGVCLGVREVEWGL